MHCVHVHVHFRLSLGANHGAGPHTKKGFMDVIRTTCIKRLYYGFEPTLVTSASIWRSLLLYTVCIYRTYYGEHPSPFTRTVMGIFGGTVVSVFACPFDVVKTRVQGRELQSLPGIM